MSDILYDMLSEEALPANEHWMVMSGAIELTVDYRAVRLAPEDIALLRANTRRHLTACRDARVIVTRERIREDSRSDLRRNSPTALHSPYSR